MTTLVREMSCSLCSETFISSKTKKIDHQLWTYLYHQNVRESITTSSTVRNNCESEEESGPPQLTFTLSVGGGPTSSRSQDADVCENCCEELEKLDNLHQELELMKKRIESQVRRINHRRGRGQGSEQQGNLVAPKLDLSFAGMVTGNENIARAISFLGGLCKDHSDNQKVKNAHDNHLSESDVNSDENESDEESNPIIIKVETKDPLEIDSSSEEEDNAYQSEPSAGPSDYKQHGHDNKSGFLLEPHFLLKEEQDPLEISEEDEDEVPPPPTPPPPAKNRRNELISCGICSKMIMRKNISVHRRIHSDIKLIDLVPCSVCGKEIVRKNLSLHMRVHTGEKPFECDICHKRFAQDSVLARHRRLHTGERPHSCNICHKRFTQTAGLRYHEKKEHGIGT